ncbi:MAG TPA: MlaD family protein [Anaeromyxobacteraceae bacterium]|nr:MlaD family protein [Anaeromyxobacteraceae bacterium]
MPSPIWNKVMANRALAVGLLVAVSGTLFLVAFTFFRKGGLSVRDSYVVTAVFDDVTGLAWKSRVQVAGIVVGEVTDIELAGDRAKVTMRVKNEIPIHSNACLAKRYPSALLPDALLEATLGSAPAPLLRDLPEDQRQITCVRDAASVAKLMESFSKIAGDIQVLSHNLAESVGGPNGSIKEIVENVTRITRSLDALLDQNAKRIGAVLENAEALTGDIRAITEQDKEHYHAIAKNVEEASERLNRVLASVESILGPADQGSKQAVQGARQALEKLNKTIDNIEKVTENLAEGKGVAGKLLMDEQLGEKMGKAVDSVSDYVDRVAAMQIKVNLRSEWLFNQSGSKAYFGVTLIPRPDKYFIFQLVSDPRGYNTVSNQTSTTQNQTTGTTVTTVTSTSTNTEQLAITAEFGKRYGPVVARVGIIESSGGAGADLLLLGDSLKLSLDFYQFTRPTAATFPNSKLWIDWNILPAVYLTAGTYDFLNSWKAGRYPFGPNFSVGRDVFVGAGVSFTDDDLKALFVGAGSAAGAAAASAATK